MLRFCVGSRLALERDLLFLRWVLVIGRIFIYIFPSEAFTNEFISGQNFRGIFK